MFGVCGGAADRTVCPPPLQARLPVVTRPVHKKQNAGELLGAGTTKAPSEDR